MDGWTCDLEDVADGAIVRHMCSRIVVTLVIT
jgi:hypothetical protein